MLLGGCTIVGLASPVESRGVSENVRGKDQEHD